MAARHDRTRPPPRRGREGTPPPQPRHAAPDARAHDPALEPCPGLRAGLAVFQRRREAIAGIAITDEVSREVEPLLAWARDARIRVERLDDRGLAARAGTHTHEGLCVFTRPRPWLGVSDLADRLITRRGVALALDRVRNPYNVGAVLRTCAFFGVDALLVGAAAPHPALGPDAVRVAEGGAEHVALTRTTDLADTLSRLRARGVHVVGTDVLRSASAFGFAYPRPVVLVVGHEREGLSDRVRAQCDARVNIPGTGAMESLNVAAASAVLLAEVLAPRSLAAPVRPR